MVGAGERVRCLTLALRHIAEGLSGPGGTLEQVRTGEMNPAFAQQANTSDGAVKARAIADFIAGMTDRFAAREHERLTGQRLLD